MMHTPGPWRIEVWHYTNGDRQVPTIQTDKDAIAQLYDLWPPDEREGERDANALLIAAAPDLLHACKLARAALPSGPELAAVMAAIEKAGGQ